MQKNDILVNASKGPQVKPPAQQPTAQSQA